MQKKFSSKKLFLLVVFLTPFIWMVACKKNNVSSPNPTPLQHKWNFISYTATVPAYPVGNFSGNYMAGDYLDFRINDTVYSYRAEYGQFGLDTATYTVNFNTITAYEQAQVGLLFVEQDSVGHISTPTNIQILTITDNLLVLSFPIRESVGGSIPTVYYPATIIDTLTR
jgi:hypothetical protein